MLAQLPERVPFAIWRPYPKYPGSTYVDTAHPKVIWHTTQGSGNGALSWYATSGGIPKLTLLESGQWYQHYLMSVADRALRNLRGGVETNRDGVINIEIAGWYRKPVTPEQREGLARMSEWFTTHGVPARWIGNGGAPIASETGRLPMSNRDWDSASGHGGHVDVPENDHNDPGFTPATLRAIERGWKQGKAGHDMMISTGTEYEDLRRVYNKAKPDEYNFVVEQVQHILKRVARHPVTGQHFYTFGKVDGKRGAITDAAWASFEKAYGGDGDAHAGIRMWDQLHAILYRIDEPAGPSGDAERIGELEAGLLEARKAINRALK